MSESRRYHLQEAVGRGSFGTVYRATMEAEGGFSKDVAVKILKPEVAAEPEMTRRLRDEARVLGLLRHRAILQVDGLVFIEGRWAVVMEFIEGISLAEAAGQARMPLGVSLEIIAEIASALHTAYNQPGPDGRPLRLIHRDIKPANIRITPAGTTKVLDFGIARADFATRESETASMLMGSFGYMSPERLDSIDGPAGDLYALGVVLYEMVVGERLGKTSSNPARHTSFRMAAVRRFEKITGEEGEEAAKLLSRMLEYDAEERPEARELEIASRRIARSLPGETLSEWAARIVPFLMTGQGEMEPEDHQLSGMTLAETRPPVSSTPISGDPTPYIPSGRSSFDSEFEAHTFPLDADETSLPDPRALPPPLTVPAAEAGTGWQRWATVAVAGLIVTLVGAIIVLTLPEQPTRGSQSDPKAPQASMDAEKAEPVEVTPAPTPPREVPPEERHTLHLDLEQLMEELDAADKPPPPPEPAKGVVNVQGDGVSLKLEGPAGRFSPGPVPVGTYQIKASFGDKPPVTAGQIKVVAGATVTLQCNAMFVRCTPVQ